MNIKKRIYLVGNPKGSYRSRVILEYLAASSKYGFYHTDPSFFSCKKSNLTHKVFYKGLRIFDKFISLSYLMVSDIVFILPMSRLFWMERVIIKILNIKVVGDFYISLYDTYVNDRKIVVVNTRAANNLLKNDQCFIDISDHLIFLNACERSYYLDLCKRKNCINKTILIPLVTNRKKRAVLPYANESSGILTLCWWGTFIPLHGLDRIIESAKFLIEKKIEFRLFIFGTSEELSLPYRQQIKDLKLTKSVFIDNSKFFSDKSLDDFLTNNCDIAFGNYGSSEKARTVMVNKVVEAASMGLPVISQETCALKEYFRHGKSIFFSDSKPEDIANKVIQLSEQKHIMKGLAESAYDLFDSQFSKQAYLKSIVEVLNGFD